MNFIWSFILLVLIIMPSLYDKTLARHCDCLCQQKCDENFHCDPDVEYGKICATNDDTGEQKTFASTGCFNNAQCKEGKWTACHLSECRLNPPLECTAGLKSLDSDIMDQLRQKPFQ